MDLTLGGLFGVLRLTLTAPRLAASYLLQAVPDRDNVRWAALGFMAVASALLMQAMSMLVPPTGPDGLTVEPPGPFFWAGMVAFGMVVTASLAHVIGRWRGGRGRFSDAVLLVAWLQFVQLALVVVQVVLLFLSPLLSQAFEAISVLLFLWLLANFVAEMHGFASTGRVLGGVMVTFLAAVLVMTALLMPLMPAGL